jgi:hypothetical protein
MAQGSVRSLGPYRPWSFDQFVGGGQKGFSDGETEGLGCLQVHDQSEFRLLDRQVGLLRSAQNLIDEIGRAPEQVRSICRA